MKEYIFTVTINEGNDEFWEGLEEKTGADEVTEVLTEAIGAFFNIDTCDVKLTKYSND